MTKKRVVLFKKQDTIDEYNELFLKNDYLPEFIPVLDHVTTNIESIRDILLLGPQQFKGLILTSQRSVEAMSKAYNLISTEITTEIKNQWNQLPVYMVGPQTAKILNEFQLFNNQSHWTIAPRAAELIPLLIKDQQPNSTLLFLAGDKRRDLIPTQLKAANFVVFEIQSYATCIHPDLSQNIKELILPSWFVYFSPSGLKFILDCIEDKKEQFLASIHIAAIGPTTADYILEQLHMHPHVMAKEPDAQHLVNAIVSYDNK